MLLHNTITSHFSALSQNMNMIWQELHDSHCNLQLLLLFVIQSMFIYIIIFNLASVVRLDAFIYDEICMEDLLYFTLIRFGWKSFCIMLFMDSILFFLLTYFSKLGVFLYLVQMSVYFYTAYIPTCFYNRTENLD